MLIARSSVGALVTRRVTRPGFFSPNGAGAGAPRPSERRRLKGERKMNDKSLRHRETAGAIIIDNFGRFLLQQRDNVVGILHPGQIGLFGGHREGNETYLECVVREIHEEIGYFVPAGRFEHLGSLEGVDIDVEGGTFRGDLFIARDIPVDALVITEGSLLIVEPDEVIEIEPRLTPTARFALKAYFDKARGA
jgi:8-oxo-dGTP diphosphatase